MLALSKYHIQKLCEMEEKINKHEHFNCFSNFQAKQQRS